MSLTHPLFVVLLLLGSFLLAAGALYVRFRLGSKALDDSDSEHREGILRAVLPSRRWWQWWRWFR